MISATSTIRLFNSIMESDMSRFIRMASQELGYPCFYINAGFSEVFVSTGIRVDRDPTWEALSRNRRNPEQILPQLIAEAGIGRVIFQGRRGEPVELEASDSDYLHLCSVIQVDGYITGYTDLLCEKSGDRTKARNAATVLSYGAAMIEKSNDAGYWTERKEKAAPLATTLLEHRFTSWSEYRSLSGITEDRLPGSFAVICVAAGETDPGMAPDDRYCGPILKAFHEEALPCEKNGMLYLLLYRLSSERQLRAICSQFSMRIMGKYRIGISALFEDPEDSEIYREQAELAVSFLQFSNSGATLCSYPENRREVLRSIPQQNGDAAAWTLPCIRTLKREDQEGGTEYFRTLYSYLALFCDKQETAKHLAIHRNTLNYRLQRIQEICDLNLEDPQTLRELFIGGYLMMEEIDIPL